MKAAWLGTWKAPWPLGRGRRWGDPAWALAAVAQAWLLGGHEGRWPWAVWEAKAPWGPRVAHWDGRAESRPDPVWIALLRHGSPQADPARERAKEGPLLAWCWEALRNGDGAPWMAYGSVLLDPEARMAWVPLLGAVEEGRLRLPPFLDFAVPEGARTLPAGWWESLLGALDAEGRLLPSGDPPAPETWRAAAPWTLPPFLDAPPEGLVGSPHLLELGGGRWMLDPRLRAWGRGWGAGPEGLRPVAASGLAEGSPPPAPVRAWLDGRLPARVPEGWSARLQADLEERLDPPPCPGPSGEPTWDRVRVRWGGELPGPAPGYPDWGVRAHPCADPFHWMAEGYRAYRAEDVEGALRGFAWAHAHFQRLGATAWARRSAANAALSALYWCDLEHLPAWERAQGPVPSPYRELAEAQSAGLRGDWEKAVRLLRAVLRSHPDFGQAWIMLGLRGLEEGRRSWMEEALPHVGDVEVRALLEAGLADRFGPPPEGLDPDRALIWQWNRLKRGEVDAAAVWDAWERTSNQWIRLDAGLLLMERDPAQRTPRRLLQLQVLADRARVPHHLERLKRLWPEAPSLDAGRPESVVEDWLRGRAVPTWVVLPAGRVLGVGAPPEGLAGRLREGGTLPPMEVEGRLWWGFPLHWEGAWVGSVLVGTAEDREGPPEGVQVLAPWLARLASPPAPPPVETGGLLWTDGSEPMASVIRVLDRVAPTGLSVLILGPSGSGKELAARELHQRSGRTGAFVPVNCAAMVESLLESELFGHVRGAFTGAARDRKGAVESAHGGTLFLDEVADLSPKLQSLLLRVIQEREVRRVGSDRAFKVDVRFLAATHRPLEEMARRGTFRQDLLFRLQGETVRMPELSARAHEFPHLVPRLLAQVSAELGRPTPALDRGVAEALARCAWPGNVRELRHALARAVLACGEGPLKAAHVAELERPEASVRSWLEATRAFQRRLLLDALDAHGRRVTDAARSLGLTRAALYAAAKRVGVDLAALRSSDGKSSE